MTRQLDRDDYVAACHHCGLDADAFEAVVHSDVRSGVLTLPTGQYWAWLIGLLDDCYQTGSTPRYLN